MSDETQSNQAGSTPGAAAGPTVEVPRDFAGIYYRGRGRVCGNRLLGPLVLITLGVVFLLEQFNLVEPYHVWNFFWTFILVFVGVQWMGSGSPMRRVWGLIAVAAGVVVAADGLGYLSFDIGRLWPLILVGLGLSMIWRPERVVHIGDGEGFVVTRRGRRVRWDRGTVTVETPGARVNVNAGTGPPTPGDEGWIEASAVLGGIQRRVTSQQFRGGKFEALFGGINLDLTRAEIAGDAAVLELTALFGGGEIRVPAHWVVDIQGQALLGSYHDETHQTVGAGAKRLVIQGTAACGGFVIKN